MDVYPDQMLCSIVLTLTPTREIAIPVTMGHQVHAAFLTALRDADPVLSEALHVSGSPARPFTVSALQGAERIHKGQLLLSPDETYWLRFTVLDIRIFERFMAKFMDGSARPALRLGKALLLIREILATPQGHPWSGYDTWPGLAARADPVKEITLDFVSPTAFGFGQQPWGKKIMVLPLPKTVFGSLSRSWNIFAPPDLHVDRRALSTYLDSNVVVTRVADLHTRMLRYRRSMQVGFVGRITYGLMADNDIAKAQLSMLADAAFYLGVGMKTTMGMGQCRRVSG